ncbi:MAG: hypothetical protein M1522_05425 [Actinobacteria bacterium]|nr:hypothetical protein [Actinomycetota bacterium]
MSGDPRQVRLVAGMAVAGLILIGLGVWLSTGGSQSSKPPERRVGVVTTTTARPVTTTTVPGRVLPAPSLSAQEVPMPPPPPATSATSACTELVTWLGTFDWQTPALPASDLAVIAIPSLATALATPTHMPPGEIAAHYVATPRVEAQPESSGAVAVAERTGSGPVLLWTCRAEAVPGRWLVTSLTPGLGGGSGG